MRTDGKITNQAGVWASAKERVDTPFKTEDWPAAMDDFVKWEGAEFCIPIGLGTTRQSNPVGSVATFPGKEMGW